MTERDDDQLELKKRARRRLVGAAAFASVAVVLLPMVMDENPPTTGHDVQIKIPGQDAPGAVPVAGKPVVGVAAQPATSGAAVNQTVPAAGDEPAKVAEAPKAEPSAKVITTSRAAGAADTDKVPGKAAAKEAAAKEAAAKEPAVKESPAKEGDARRAQAILDGKAQAAPHVVLIGAFANTANVKSLQAKLADLGVKTYTEPLDSPQGKKTRLRAGPFPSREAAEKAQSKMKRIGVNGVVAAKP